MEQDTPKRHKKNRVPTPTPPTKASPFCVRREGADGSTWEGGWPRTLRAQLQKGGIPPGRLRGRWLYLQSPSLDDGRFWNKWKCQKPPTANMGQLNFLWVPKEP